MPGGGQIDDRQPPMANGNGFLYETSFPIRAAVRDGVRHPTDDDGRSRFPLKIKIARDPAHEMERRFELRQPPRPEESPGKTPESVHVQYGTPAEIGEPDHLLPGEEIVGSFQRERLTPGAGTKSRKWKTPLADSSRSR